MSRSTPGLAAGLLLAGMSALACSEGSLLSPALREGGSRIWEVSADSLPSAYDVFFGRRLFLGSGQVGGDVGDLFLDGAPGSDELRLRSLASLLRAEPARPVGLQDLGQVDFDAVDEVPEEGYTDSEDMTGLPVVQGHVYAIRLNRSSLGDNFAKLVVDGIGATEGDLDRQFIDFRFVVQTQPGNERFEEG